ncbi:AlpA family phage regulatory protein [Rhizobium sp. OAE497]|uniref:helix-turn-helix transcriptional regulator n=1 Tax=Rhizobium sp. OAE497 TaxID=2663796 RepID=UPI0018F67437
MNGKLLNIDAVRKRVPVSEVSIWRWQKAGKFPKPVRIGRRILWRSEDIDRFLSADANIDTRVAAAFMLDADQLEVGQDCVSQRAFADSRQQRADSTE